ncbi:hypothetical protein BDD12DRAFT_864582 [Trichophaea hybrida]|nr:hypothetical protein BDD12DRAFT_864582 [Trichophaea hybrida]
MQSRSPSNCNDGAFTNPSSIIVGEDRENHNTIIDIPSDGHGDIATASGSQIEMGAMDSTTASYMMPPNTAPASFNPRKPAGYERVSKFMDSDKDFLIFRRFGELNVRNILYLQDRLSEITEKLAEEDEKPDPKPGTRRWDDNKERADLMEKAEELLRRYNDAIRSYSEILKLPRASIRQHRILKEWLDYYNPLYSEEQDFIEYRDDLLSIINLEDDATHRLLLSHPKLMERMFGKTNKTSEEQMVYYSTAAVRFTSRLLTVLGGLVILLIPIVLLTLYGRSVKAKLIIVSSFVALFSIVVAGITHAKSWEVVAATAAYAAVLVSFMH